MTVYIGKSLSAVTNAICPHCGIIPADQVCGVHLTNIDGDTAVIFKHRKFGCFAQVAFTLQKSRDGHVCVRCSKDN